MDSVSLCGGFVCIPIAVEVCILDEFHELAVNSTDILKDGQRRVDYVLTYPVKKLGGGHSSSLPSSPVADMDLGCPGETINVQEDHKAFRREEFEGKLRDMGLELEKDEDAKTPGMGFVKIHAPWNVLCREAEFMKLKMPTKKVYEVKKSSGVVGKISSLVSKVLEPLHPHVEEHQPKNIKHLSHTFSREKEHFYTKIPFTFLSSRISTLKHSFNHIQKIKITRCIPVGPHTHSLLNHQI
uniref:Anoctamin dimerisation domain-containing protein n=1 Tax=Seriola dumerili TaxID=41447 RepID=A0A3B4V7A0_SERDU